jgi:hypothetical protein
LGRFSASGKRQGEFENSVKQIEHVAKKTPEKLFFGGIFFWVGFVLFFSFDSLPCVG